MPSFAQMTEHQRLPVNAHLNENGIAREMTAAAQPGGVKRRDGV
jgi:hypothetical protein